MDTETIRLIVEVIFALFLLFGGVRFRVALKIIDVLLQAIDEYTDEPDEPNVHLYHNILQAASDKKVRESIIKRRVKIRENKKCG